jgi:pyridoxine/pyridoxamine 5'-phosphate oxidase
MSEPFIPRDDLGTIEADLWVRLGRGKADRKSPWHTTVVGTADGDLRVMVLRAVDRAAGALRFHTDARSPKVAALAADPRVSLLFYDAGAKLQLRCRGIGVVGTSDAATDAAWAASAATSRRCYLALAAPSSRADAPTSGLSADHESRFPTLAETEAGRGNFATLLVTLDRIDWLYLAHDGHRRALFERPQDQAGAPWQAGWLIP